MILCSLLIDFIDLVGRFFLGPSLVYKLTVIPLGSSEYAHPRSSTRSHTIYILGNIFPAVGAWNRDVVHTDSSYLFKEHCQKREKMQAVILHREGW
jgi:hypothetical protein